MIRLFCNIIKIIFFFSTGFFLIYGLYRMFNYSKKTQLLLPGPKKLAQKLLSPPPPVIYIGPLSFYLNNKIIQRVRMAGQFLGAILLTGFVSYIFLTNFAPFGITIQYASENDHENISELGPKNRIKTETQNGQNIFHLTDDLVYFETKMPFQFDYATVRLTFKNSDPDQILSLGFHDQEKWHYDTKPFDVPFLNSLPWQRKGNNPVLYQRKPHFGSTDDFLKNLPKNTLIGTYEYDKNTEDISHTQIQDYKPQSQETIIDKPLRGKHVLYAYLKNEPFHIKIQKQDLNWYEDPDTMTVKIYKDNDLVFQKTADDDGITDASRKVLPPEEIDIKNPGPDLPENGVYKIIIDASDDTIINRITTNLHKLVFQGSVFLAGNHEAYPKAIASTSATTIYTNALTVSAMTNHNAGKQNIMVENQILTVNKLNFTQVLTPEHDFSKIVIPNNDVILEGFQGYFAFDPNQFFLPTPYHIIPISSKDDIDITDYILSDYHPSRKQSEWQVNEQTFDMQSAYIKDNKLGWLIKAPGLKDNKRNIVIKSIDITFYKKPWIQ